MNREETLALWQKCEDAREAAKAAGKNNDEAHADATKIWNEWADRLRIERGELDDEAKHQFERDHLGGSLGLPSAVQDWWRKSNADFSNESKRRTFDADVDFRGWIFPGDACFTGATFRGVARFQDTKINGMAAFSNAIFEKKVEFHHARFKSSAGFTTAEFKQGVNFGDASFEQLAEFSDATFGGTANFGGAKLHGHTSFAKATFCYDAVFTSIECNRFFDLCDTRFLRVPNFIQASFDEPPGLDKCRIAAPCMLQLKLPWDRGTCRCRLPVGRPARHVDDPTRYRWMRRLAESAKDGDRELAFFVGEIKSERWLNHWPWPRTLSAQAFRGVIHFWAGLLYALFSDYGRSVVRPLLWWIVVVGISMLAYISYHPNLAATLPAPVKERQISVSWSTAAQAAWRRQPCFTTTVDTAVGPSSLVGLPVHARHASDSSSEALMLSLRNSLIVLDLGTETNTRILGCLYGLERTSSTTQTYMPYAVSKIAGTQRFLSAILIFLIGLGIRNMLKMK